MNMALALNNPRRLICYKTKKTNQNRIGGPLKANMKVILKRGCEPLTKVEAVNKF